jgi:hypothetical protein
VDVRATAVETCEVVAGLGALKRRRVCEFIHKAEERNASWGAYRAPAYFTATDGGAEAG